MYKITYLALLLLTSCTSKNVVDKIGPLTIHDPNHELLAKLIYINHRDAESPTDHFPPIENTVYCYLFSHKNDSSIVAVRYLNVNYSSSIASKSSHGSKHKITSFEFQTDKTKLIFDLLKKQAAIAEIPVSIPTFGCDVTKLKIRGDHNVEFTVLGKGSILSAIESIIDEQRTVNYPHIRIFNPTQP